MTRYFVELAYDGTLYHGWQIQPNAATVQETIEKVLSTYLSEEISVTGCGRTDTGVHAKYFVAHFESENIPAGGENELLFKINQFLPADIVFFSIKPVTEEMHARFSAKSRTYRYVISVNKPLFNRKFCHYYYGPLDSAQIEKACTMLKAYIDFTSFSKLHTDVKSNDCKIEYARWSETDDGYIFEIKSDRFLRNMVRSIVGTLLDVGSGKTSLEDFKIIIESKDRSRAGMSASAKGLFLVDVQY